MYTTTASRVLLQYLRVLKKRCSSQLDADWTLFAHVPNIKKARAVSDYQLFSVRTVTIMSSNFCSQTCPLANGESVNVDVDCSGKIRLERALQKYFQYEFFRPGQLESLLPLVHGRDVFSRMATGAGKSLCMFLVPLALGESAIGVVISPLNALMQQQV